MSDDVTPFAALNEEILTEFRTKFYASEKNLFAQNVCSRIDPFDACLSRKSLEEAHHVYEYKVENEGKPVSNQKNSGRCWIFATLNVIRLPFMKALNIDDFEFSQAYLFFWDKIERCNYFLNNIVETAKRNETVDGRLVSFLLNVNNLGSRVPVTGVAVSGPHLGRGSVGHDR